MTANTLNQNEWHKSENWSRMGMFGIYFSKIDTRLWVPKAIPAFGWTINFAHRHAVLWLAAVIAIPALTAVAATLITFNR